jgi:hypothetical protein
VPDIAEEHRTFIIRIKPDLKDERHHSLSQKVSNYSLNNTASHAA